MRFKTVVSIVVAVLLVVLPSLAAYGAFAGDLNLSLPQLKGLNFIGGIKLVPEFVALLFGLVLYTAAFIAEIVRAGIEAVPKGQWEVSQILGLSKTQAFFSVVLPQTGKIVMPPLIGQYLSLIKDTSIVSMIGMSELMHAGQAIVDRVGKPVEIYGLVAVLYFVVCFPLSQWVRHHDRRRSLLS